MAVYWHSRRSTVSCTALIHTHTYTYKHTYMAYVLQYTGTLGDQVCHAPLNCSEWSFDDGDCTNRNVNVTSTAPLSQVMCVCM